jgi:putative flippase GtrA
VKRFLHFSAGGAVGFAVQIAALAALVEAGLHYAAATAVAVEAAILVNFAWHERWTWRDRTGASGGLRRLWRFNALTAVTSIAGGVIVTALLVESLGLPPVAANILSVAALGVVNFVGADTLVFRAGVAAVLVAAAALAPASTLEAKLQEKTVRDFARYVAAVEARRANEVASGQPFLHLDRHAPAERARLMTLLRRGEVVVERAATARDAAGREITVDGGLVNHWRGTVFVPGVALDHLLKVLQEPQADKHKQVDVISSRVVSRDGDSQKVYLRLRRTKFVTVVYDTEYDVDYLRLTPGRALSNSISTRIVEVEHAGTPRERTLPEGDDHGYMWRLNSYWRYQQVDGGVLVEIESLTLSRDLPPIIGPLIRPIITSTARESMARTLASVRARFTLGG